MKGLKLTFPMIVGAADYHQFREFQTLVKEMTGAKPSYRELNDYEDDFDGPTELDVEKAKGYPVRHLEGKIHSDYFALFDIKKNQNQLG